MIGNETSIATSPRWKSRLGKTLSAIVVVGGGATAASEADAGLCWTCAGTYCTPVSTGSNCKMIEPDYTHCMNYGYYCS